MDYETKLREIERKLEKSKQIESFYRGLSFFLFSLLFTTFVGIAMFLLGTQIKIY